jgi:2-dehydropantoate 2-reductase
MTDVELQPMKIVVVGCGAMGSIYAALLADAGNDVTVVDPWVEHIRTIQSKGLRVEGASGDRTVRVDAHTSIPSTAADLVIVAVKAAHVPAVADQLGPLINPRTLILTIQNGVGSADVLAQNVPAERLSVGIAGGFGALMRGPGHAYHNGMNLIRIGPFSDLAFCEIQRIADVWRTAGFKVEAVPDVRVIQWEKLICNVAYSAPCALTGMTVGEMMDDPDMGPVSRAAALEAWKVALALGIPIKIEDPIKLVREFAANMRAAKPSLLQDLENRRHGEIDVINGAVSRMAAKVGMDAPVNATLVALVKQRERGFTTR